MAKPITKGQWKAVAKVVMDLLQSDEGADALARVFGDQWLDDDFNDAFWEVINIQHTPPKRVSRKRVSRG